MLFSSILAFLADGIADKIDKVILISGKFGIKDSTTKVEIINLNDLVQ